MSPGQNFLSKLRSLSCSLSKGAAATLLCAILGTAPVCFAFGADAISDSLRALTTVGATHSEVRDKLASYRQSIAIVFVPGILGSQLTDSSGKVIWGDAGEALTDFPGFLKRFALPASLVDETADQGVKAEVLGSMFSVDFYGKALERIKSEARTLHIDVFPCGYDWRRDIRWAARELNRCIDSIPGTDRSLVVLAHSMGGLVTWQWAADRKAGQLQGKHHMLQAVLLGSPLAGSCEILRMVQTGYVMPTANDALHVPNEIPAAGAVEWLVDALARVKGTLANGLFSTLSQEIRPLVLSWPGALELTPKPINDRSDEGCVEVPSDPDNGLSPLVSYYEPSFWTLPVSKEMLGSYAVPSSLSNVLSKARGFRTKFKASPLDVPTWLYFSQAWKVPSKLLTMTDNGVVKLALDANGNGWLYSQGDGRVPQSSARAEHDGIPFSYLRGIPSVHGNLPADENFLADYFHDRLPRFIDAYLVESLAHDLTGQQPLLKAYTAAGGTTISVDSIAVAYEPHRSTPLAAATTSAKDAIASFNSAVVAVGGASRPRSYSQLRVLNGGNPTALQWQRLAERMEMGHSDYAFVQGRLGLRQAQDGNWDEAMVALDASREAFGDLPQGSTLARQAQIDGFKRLVQRNLGKSLYVAGYCKEAEPLLRSASDWPFAREALAKPCNDYSGLLYCFSDGDYCRPE